MTVLGNQPTRPARQAKPGADSVLIEIGDEAYKQNRVYCSWDEIIASEKNASSDSPPRDSKVRAVTG